MHTVAILQARLSSTRLPRKILADLAGKPVIEHCIDRLKASSVNEVCVALPVGMEHDNLADNLLDEGVSIARGHEHDVLARFLSAAHVTKADIIVRATADNPLVSISNIDRQVKALLDDPRLEYCDTEGLPIGMSSEALTAEALGKLSRLAVGQEMREHVTLYLQRHREQFSARALRAPNSLARPNYKLSIDTGYDYNLMKRIYNALYLGQPINEQLAIELIDSEAELRTMACCT